MGDPTALEPHRGAQLRFRAERGIAELAERQYGVVARGQLIDLGIGRRAIGHRLAVGRLHLVHRGVYAVGHRVLSAQGRWMAAVLAGGRGAALSHRSAAALWELRVPVGRVVDVTVPHPVHPRSGLNLHSSSLRPDEVTTVQGIRVTTAPRTLLDLAAVLHPRHVGRAVQEADARRLTDVRCLEDLLARRPRRRGNATIRAILADGAIGAGITRSELEDRFLVFLAAAGLPPPQVNAALRIGDRWIEADCLWRRSRLVAELDGHAWHRTAAAYERDRARDRTLSAAGWRVVRITWRQLHRDGDALAADLGTLLAGRGYAPP